MTDENLATPCDDCRFRAWCAQEGMACRAYMDYASTGRWRKHSERSPSVSNYQRMMRDEEEERSPGAQKITPEDRVLMRALYRDGMPVQVIAAKFEICVTSVKKAVLTDSRRKKRGKAVSRR